MEKKQLGGSIELRETDSGKTIAGYAAVFYRDSDPGSEYGLWDGAVERIMPGAFDNFRDHDVRALFNHDSNQVLGRQKSGTLKLSVDERGLRYEITPNDSATYRNVAGMIERGDVDGSSFQFFIRDQEWRDLDDGREVREIKEVELLDVGPVTFPAYSSATSEASSADARSSEAYQQHCKRREAEQAQRAANKRRLNSINLP